MVDGRHFALAGLTADSLSESEATRRVVLAAAGLGLLGVIMLIATIWWWRSTRAEHPSLAPLEVMSARRWFRSNEAQRSRLVEQVRPEGAERSADAFRPEPVDLSVLAAGDHAGFDDLRDIDLMLGLRLPGSLAADGESASESFAERPAVVDAVADELDDVDEPVVPAIDAAELDDAVDEVADNDVDADAVAAEPDVLAGEDEDQTSAISTGTDAAMDHENEHDDDVGDGHEHDDDVGDEHGDVGDEQGDVGNGGDGGDGEAIDPLLQRASTPD